VAGDRIELLRYPVGLAGYLIIRLFVASSFMYWGSLGVSSFSLLFPLPNQDKNAIVMQNKLFSASSLPFHRRKACPSNTRPKNLLHLCLEATYPSLLSLPQPNPLLPTSPHHHSHHPNIIKSTPKAVLPTAGPTSLPLAVPKTTHSPTKCVNITTYVKVASAYSGLFSML
jgi:hypothetical protein